MSSLTDRLDDRLLLGSLLKGPVGGTVPIVGAAAFGVASAVLSFVFARRRD